MATSEMPSAAAEQQRDVRRPRRLGAPAAGTPAGSTPMTETPCDARSRTIDSAIATTTATRMPGRPRRHSHEAQDDGEAEQADAERPGIRLVEALEERARLGDEPARVGAESEQLGQLADEDHDRETGQVPGPDRVREQVGDEAELGCARADRDEPDQEREHPSEGDRLLLVAGGKRQDRRRDHRARARNPGPGRGSATVRRGRRRPGRRRSCTDPVIAGSPASSA